MLQSLNHITFAVRNLNRSIDFYREVLGFHLHAKWDQGAYLTIGDCWLCLAVDNSVRISDDYSHTAFSIDEKQIRLFKKELERRGITIWKQDNSEGDSVYFLDPDDRKLEAHVGNLDSRMNAVRANPYSGFCTST